MRRDELYVEELLCNDAAKIVIDEEFKKDLKNRIMFGGECNNITELPKRKNNFKQNRYLKIASGFVICVFVSGTIFKTIDVSNKDMISKGEVIIPITTQKYSEETASKKTDELQTQADIVDSDEAKKPSVAKATEGSKTKDTSHAVASTDKKNKASIDKTNSNTNYAQSDSEINNSLTNVVKGASINIGIKGPIDVPKMGEVQEEAGEVLKCYDSRYSFDAKRKVSVKNGGIYIEDIESSVEQKLISYNKNTHVVEKPNFTPDDSIIYYKAEKVNLEDGVIDEKNGAIYLCDKNGQGSTKIIDGKNPMISKDGKKLVYEAEGKIYILTLSTNAKRLVDIGRYPAWSDDGNLISYVKEEKETQSYDVSTEKKDVYIEKSFSSLWLFDLANENTRSLTNNEAKINNNNIESWAEDVRSGNVTSNFDVTSRYSYFESIWSSNNKEVYVIRKNNEAQVFELIKFSLGN